MISFYSFIFLFSFFLNFGIKIKQKRNKTNKRSETKRLVSIVNTIYMQLHQTQWSFYLFPGNLIFKNASYIVIAVYTQTPQHNQFSYWKTKQLHDISCFIYCLCYCFSHSKYSYSILHKEYCRNEYKKNFQ